MNSHQCCPDDDGAPQICVIENKFGFGECKPRHKIADVYPPGTATFGYKKAGMCYSFKFNSIISNKQIHLLSYFMWTWLVLQLPQANTKKQNKSDYTILVRSS